MTQESFSPALRAAVLAALAAYVEEERHVKDLSSTSDMWRVYGRQMQMAARYDGRRVRPSLPIDRLARETAPWRALR